MILSDGVQYESASEKHGRFAKAINDRSNMLDPSQDSRVIQSRETVADAYASYHQNQQS